MIRLAISVEGQAEKEFVDGLLAPHLWNCRVWIKPILLGRARNRGIGGGGVTVPKLVSEMVTLSRSFDAVTTFVDFYGFTGRERHSADELEQMIRSGFEEVIGQQDERLVPYVQLHEFEGLLFSEVSAFKVLRDIPTRAVLDLTKVRSAFATPEDINDDYHTAPSRRIADAVQGYRKLVDGPLIAARTGLETIRAECPRFNAWLKRLETLQERIEP